MSFTFELVDCTNVLLREIVMKEAKQKHIACTYRLALQSTDKTDWRKVNQAIMERWSKAGLKRIKEWAWKGG
ncbi:hypothetical protein LCGC14_0911000 [marine sediment metagenome]|uniref:Uncharacterized protein n=1 Tax=marine sediment metagenome TaxID=412755 RepID=A0A0F9NYB5_9ZZZZ|nr:hypothetical protein [Candidatus Aminicenantes bacterium]